MIRSEATVSTSRPGPYLKQLCRHFGHKAPTRFDDHSGQIEFPFGACDLMVATPTVLSLRASAGEVETLRRVEEVVGSHLERFGRRDGLVVEWSEPGAGA